MQCSHKIIKKMKKPALLITTALVMNGCQAVTLPTLPTLPTLSNFTSQPVPGPAMADASLPTFNVGDKYYYSNGARDQVISITGETINFQMRSKRKISNFRNLVIPTPYIEGQTSEYFKKSDTPANVLWPLHVGNSAKFSTRGMTVRKATGDQTPYNQVWDCEVEGTERVLVFAGEFDTFRIKCRRMTSSGKWWQNRTWNYSPMLGTYVLRRDFHKKSGVRIRELTALRPSLTDEPQNVRKGIIRAWQTALENKQAGGLVSWTDKQTKTSIQVEPVRTFRAENGQFCRTYKEYLTRKGTTRIYAGVACRAGKFRWLTPRRRS